MSHTAPLLRASILESGLLLAALSLFALIALSPARLQAQRTPPSQGPPGETKPVDLSGRWIHLGGVAADKDEIKTEDYACNALIGTWTAGLVYADIEISQTRTHLTARILITAAWHPDSSKYSAHIDIFEGEIRGNKVELQHVGGTDFILPELNSERSLTQSFSPSEPFVQAYAQSNVYAWKTELLSYAKSLPVTHLGKSAFYPYPDTLDMRVFVCPKSLRAFSGLAMFWIEDPRSVASAWPAHVGVWYRASAEAAERWRAADFDALFGKPKPQPAKAARTP